MQQSIQPLNVAAATLLVQLLLITLLAITSSLVASSRSEARLRIYALGESHEERQDKTALRKAPTLFVALASFAVLLISDELYSIWSPIFQGVGINTISAASAISTVFILDIALISYLMFATGGSRSSPFLSALFTVPALAIFLRLPPAFFGFYAAVACLAYLALSAPALERGRTSHSAAAFMNIACLMLSMFTGYITRPVPINELTPRAQPSAAPASSSPSSTAASR